MRTMTKMLVAAAMLVVLAPSGAKAAAILSVREAGTLSTNIVLPPGGGSVNVEIVLAADAAGVSSLGYNLVGALLNSFSFVTFNTLAQFSAPTVPGPTGALGVVHATFASGPASATGVIATATFAFTSSGGLNFEAVESYDNLGDGPIDVTTNGLSVAVVPEPGTLLLLGFGLTGLVVAGRRG